MNFYAEAIEICSTERDWKSIVIAIAKKHPKTVVEAVDAKSWKPSAKKLLDQGFRIEAIKYCRDMTGWGLKEAKDAVDALNE